MNQYLKRFNNPTTSLGAAKLFRLNLPIFLLVFVFAGFTFAFVSHAAGIIGDIDGDGTVTAHDLSLLLSHYNTAVTINTNGDLDGDAQVTGHDLSLLLSHYGQSSSPSPSPSPTPTGGGQTTNCAPSPAICGYPDPNYDWTAGQNAWGSTGGGVGPTVNGVAETCSSLPSSGSIASTTTNQTISNLNINGYIHVTSSGVTINNACIIQPGGGPSVCTNSVGWATTACWPIVLNSGANGTHITNTYIAGANTSSQSVIGIVNVGDPNPVLDHIHINNCSECVHDGPWTINNSYINNNGVNGAHPENQYQSGGTYTANHVVFWMPINTDAALFGDTNGGGGGACDNHYTVKNSLFNDTNHNSNYIIGTCSSSSSAGSATMDFENNDFAGSGHGTDGGIVWDSNYGQLGNNHGAWCSSLASLIWTGNYFDGNGATLYCSTSGNAPTGP